MKRFASLLLITFAIPGCFHSVTAAEAPATQPAHTYQLVVADCTWTQASQAAKDAGGHLACFETQEEFNAVLNQIASENLSNIMFLIGGRRDLNSTEYHWDYGDGLLQGETLNSPSSWVSGQWMKGEPSFGDAGEAECFMETYFYTEENRWIFNDVPDDIIAVVPGYSGKIGYIIELGDPLNTQPASADNTGTGQGPVLETEASSPTWKTAYNSFILNQDYLNDPDRHFGDTTLENTLDLSRISYALHDMNNDGTPELLIFNGDGTYAGSVCYLYQYADNAVSYVDQISCTFSPDYYLSDNPDLPGLFLSTVCIGGEERNSYYSFDGSLVEEPISINNNDTLYQTLQNLKNNDNNKLTFSTLDELNQTGWDTFVTQYGFPEPDPAPAPTQDPSAKDNTAQSSLQLPEEVLADLPLDLFWHSGAGNMALQMLINADGSYENNSSCGGYVSSGSAINGTLTPFTQIDDYTWTAQIGSVSYIHEPGTTYMKGEFPYTATETTTSPGDTIYLYLPGHPYDTLPEVIKNYMAYVLNSNMSGSAITGYALFNETAGEGYYSG